MSSSAPEENSVLLSPPRQRSGRERKDPSITPRKFRRFFTPRSRVPSQPSPARKALRDLGAPSVNQRYQTPAPSSPLKPLFEEESQDEHPDFQSFGLSKRRKIQHTPESSPIRLSLSRASQGLESGLLSPIRSLSSSQEICELDDEYSDGELPTSSHPPKRLLSLPNRGLAGQLAQRELGGLPRAGHSYMSYPAADWRIDTANFYSRPDDVHSCTSNEGPGQCIPFCAATCHRSGITAIGDEEGRVRLLDSSSNSSEPFSSVHLTFTAHTNAIIDLHFSDDDYLLATASGDQTGKVIDMITQSPIAYLGQHTGSLKQIRFQPGKSNNSVLATSSRDGSVQIWDLRCSRPVQDFDTSDNRDTNLSYRLPPPKCGYAINSFYHAHARTSRQIRQSASIGPGDTPSRREMPSRSNDVSVTTLQFLPPGQEHLLLTACEADASIKLWDIRSIHSSRNKVPSPLSTTAPPESHDHWRPFGISSLALGTDASRLYALCKDNTVYAYSTAHLILGHAPELSCRNGEPPRRRHNATTQQGLGPLYGFRHPSFHATSFYIKCAVRPARDGKSELLAVGSNNSCAVVFPTQERYFEEELSGMMSNKSLDNSTIGTTTGPEPSMSTKRSVTGVRRPLFRTNSSTSLSTRPKDDIPIIRKGTPLVRGHGSEREVGSVTWTNEGKLVTVGDDYLIRCWSEDREQAADLRTGGETGGRRWCCGWAETGDDWDVPDDDEN
ncbi:putative wd repeat protein [Rosellinia necatrix]|uniref:Putative wd repeat protein n=1 Tax=Rosellinia necatrix TaxID=77044 RepID=A0A1W2TLH3_ROSNE|nr:putative wd repeat protein [Rosellinia necatrix]